MKICTVCGTSHTNPKVGKCPDCFRKYRAAWYAKNRARVRDQQRYGTFGITGEQYVALRDKQGGKCAICENACPTGRRLAVDHDHATGAVRGLLCANCNQALGKFKDDTALLRRAASYLENPPWQPPH